MFESLRREAAAKGDIVVLPLVWESYHNITHQTLEVLRFAAADRDATHVLKVGLSVILPLWRGGGGGGSSRCHGSCLSEAFSICKGLIYQIGNLETKEKARIDGL